MECIRQNKFKLHNSVVTLGKFDGLHIGHQLLIKKICSLKQLGYQAVVFTFSQSPVAVLYNEIIEVIYTEIEKIQRLKTFGVDIVISYPFTKEVAAIEPEQFIKDILIGQLDAKIIVVGEDYRFGANRQGDIALLKKFSFVYGYEVIVYPKLVLHNECISSSTIREKIKQGEMEQIIEMLGVPYSITGEVIHGRKLGRTLGMPTTNILPDPNKLLPPNGVYTSKMELNGVYYYGVSNIGLKPTVSDGLQIGLETYWFHYNGDLYGQVLEVQLYHYLRNEHKFQSIEQLKEQIKKDIQLTKLYFHI